MDIDSEYFICDSHRSGSGSVKSTGQKSKSGHSTFSKVSSKLSRSSSNQQPASANTSGGGRPLESDEDSEDFAQTMEANVGLGMRQKIEALKIRRRSDRIIFMLTAASRGNLEALKDSIRVIPVEWKNA